MSKQEANNELKSRPSKDSVPVNLRIPRELRDSFKQRVSKDGKTLSGAIRCLMEETLKT